MIEYRKLDVTTVSKGIVSHGVNCQKKMGSGVAAAIKKKWPKAYEAYLERDPKLGTVDLVEIRKNLWVANCYTQRYYGFDKKRYASLKAIENCFLALAEHAYKLHQEVFMPKIGCGLGGLDWREVEPILATIDVTYSSYSEVGFIVCEL